MPAVKTMRTTENGIFKLMNPLREYAWGSADGITLFTGIDTHGVKPAAECWMGAHPDDSSMLMPPEGSRETAAISLREHLADRGEELPFLFKVLSAARPLSIQVHPDKARAEAGFAREEAAGRPRASPKRNYRDSNHKPELAVALSPGFRALCGFRNAEEASWLMGPQLRDFLDFDAAKGESAYKALLSRVLTLSESDRIHLEDLALARAPALEQVSESSQAPARVARAASAAVRVCYRNYPRDPGAISPFFMQVIELAPGEGLYIPVGVLHAYMSGTMLEIMASSDNVIRGGLTPKHIDVDELLSALDFQAKPRIVNPQPIDPEGRELLWPTPAREFSLSRVRLEPGVTTSHNVTSPEILLCPQGWAILGGHSAAIKLIRGESAFVDSGSGSYSLEGDGYIYRARRLDSPGGTR